MSIGNVRDAATNKTVPGTGWQSVQVLKQARASESDPWMMECNFAELPKCLQSADAVGKAYDLDIKCEVQEIERRNL